jgi:eukaryotic-like serine/threonine-protein kinase
MPGAAKSLSGLLDEALALPVDERLPWVDRLGEQHAAHRERLRAMLMRACESERFLGTLPKLDTTGEDEVARFPSHSHAPGERIGEHTLLRLLGSGAMGVVWLARPDREPREVAIKLAHVASKRSDLRARLAREQALLAKLDHPNIARLLGGGVTTAGQPYLVLEHVKGVQLDVYRQAHAPALETKLALFLQITLAVAHAHERAIVHRDLKPANVMVCDNRTVRLLDFGVGKLLANGVPEELQLSAAEGRPMTPAYAAPEQLVGHEVDFAADIYALGGMLYELLTGVRPYQRFERSPFELGRAIMQEQPTAPSRHPGATELAKLPLTRRMELDLLVLKALAKRASDRHRSARVLAEIIHRALH